jgi:hypothetical protein
MNFVGHSKQSIRIAKLTMQETGTYNPIHQRPYMTHITGDTMQSIGSRLEQAGSGTITGSLLGGIASTIMAPSATPGETIHIPYGWAERRIRFILEVHAVSNTGTTTIFYFQGFTDYLGVSTNGNVDPKMTFVLNSFIRVNRLEQLGPMGYTTRDTVTLSSQIINPEPNAAMKGTHKMRPQEVFTGIQSGYIENAHSYVEPGIGYIDGRLRLGTEAIGSNRENNLPSYYVSKVFDTHRQAYALADFGQNDSDIYSRGVQLSLDTMLVENPFIRALSQARGVPVATTFTYGDLVKIDPNVIAATNCVRLGQTFQSSVHQTGQSEYWNSANRETVVATMLSNAVPAIMMSLFISKVTFMSTNQSSMGQIHTQLLGGSSVTAADMSQAFQVLKNRLDNEVFMDISYAGQQLYTLEMDIDIFGETKISISIDGGPAILYVTPSFCDGLLVPVISPNKQIFDHNVHNFEQMFKVVEQSMTPSQSHSIINSIV